MRRALTLEAVVEPPGGTLLLQIALILREQQLDPESVAWIAVSSGNLVTVRLTLRPSAAKLMAELSARFRAIPEVVHVALCDLKEP